MVDFDSNESGCGLLHCGDCRTGCGRSEMETDGKIGFEQQLQT